MSAIHMKKDIKMIPGWWLNHPFEKYARQNGFIFPNFRGENSKNIWNHHLDTQHLSRARLVCRAILPNPSMFFRESEAKITWATKKTFLLSMKSWLVKNGILIDNGLL